MMNRAAYLLCLAVGLLTGCEEALAPGGEMQVPFAMYGVISPDLDTQSVRIYLPEEFPTPGSSVPADVDFTSVDLVTGERRVWRDSVVADSDGRFGTVFWSAFTPEFGHRYRLEAARRSNGAMSVAEVSIPLPVEVRIDESDAPLLHVFVEGDDFRLFSPEAVYDVYRPNLVGEFKFRPLRYEVAYAGRAEPVERGWRVTFNMIVDGKELNYLYNGELGAFGGVCAVDTIFLEALELHAFVGDTTWNPPGGVFDPAILSQPTSMTNVENGFGFVGAGYRLMAPLYPSRETIIKACFRYEG